MDDMVGQQITAAADRMASAAETFERLLERLDAQYQSLNLKVDRIVAAIEEEETEEDQTAAASVTSLQSRVRELEQANADLKAQSSRLGRKTLPGLVSAVLGKNDLEHRDFFEAVRPALHREVDLGHAALCDAANQRVAAERNLFQRGTTNFSRLAVSG